MPTKNSVDWNARCELFNAERVAKDLHDIGAGYYFITLMQGRKYMYYKKRRIQPFVPFGEKNGTWLSSFILLPIYFRFTLHLQLIQRELISRQTLL